MEKELTKTVVLDYKDTSEDSRKQAGFDEVDFNQDALELAISQTEKHCKINGVVIGTLLGFDDSNKPLVDFPLNHLKESLVARSTVILDKEKRGREVTLMFEDGDLHKPVITGVIQHPEETQSINAEIDGERKVITAKKEIVLRCGKASITLTRAGKVIIRGTYLLNRSSGVNKIKGGSVQIN